MQRFLIAIASFSSTGWRLCALAGWRLGPLADAELHEWEGDELCADCNGAGADCYDTAPQPARPQGLKVSHTNVSSLACQATLVKQLFTVAPAQRHPVP